jgi:hypothetical protein
MSYIQLVAVRNTLNESLEITRWIDINKINKKDIERLEKELIAIVERLYLKLSRNKKHEEAMAMIGISSEVLNISQDEAKKFTNKIHYILYEGHCLDPERLSYFLPEKTIEEGELTLEEVKKILSK